MYKWTSFVHCTDIYYISECRQWWLHVIAMDQEEMQGLGTQLWGQWWSSICLQGKHHMSITHTKEDFMVWKLGGSMQQSNKTATDMTTWKHIDNILYQSAVMDIIFFCFELSTIFICIEHPAKRKLYEKLNPLVEQWSTPMNMLPLPPTSSLEKEKGHIP